MISDAPLSALPISTSVAPNAGPVSADLAVTIDDAALAAEGTVPLAGALAVTLDDAGVGQGRCEDNLHGAASADQEREHRNRAPKTWSLEGSNDDSSWTTLISRSNDTGWQRYETRAYRIPDQGDFRYYRFNVTAVDGGTSPAIEEIYLASAADGLSFISDPRMLGTPFDINGGLPRSAMFDGAGSPTFQSAISQGWVGVRLLTAQTITEITWSSLPGSPTYTPSAGAVERSPDGIRWQTVWTFSGWTSWTSGETKVSTKP